MSFMYLVEFKGAVVERTSYQARIPTPKSYVTSDKVTWHQSIEEKIVAPTDSATNHEISTAPDMVRCLQR